MKKKFLAMLLAVVIAVSLLPTAFAADGVSGVLSVKLKAADGGAAIVTFSSGTVLEALIPFDTGNEWVTVIMTPYNAPVIFDKAADGRGYFGAYVKAIEEEGDYYSDDTSYLFDWGPSHADADIYYTWTYALSGPFFGFLDYSDPYGYGLDTPTVWLYDLVKYTTMDGKPIYFSVEGVEEELFLETRPGKLPEEPEESDPVSVKVKAADGGAATVTFSSATIVDALIPFKTGAEWVTLILMPDSGVIMTLDKTVDGRGYFGAYMETRDWDDMSYFCDWGVSHADAGSYTWTYALSGPFFGFYEPDSEVGFDAVWLYDLIQYTTTDGKPIYISSEGMEEFFLETKPGELPDEPTEPETPTFTDVKTTDYYAPAVTWAVEKGVTKGKTSTTFDPFGSCTRAEIVTFLWRACDKPEPKSTVNPFTDVKPSAYYYKAVLWAVENGIVNGTTATTFGPKGTCTRRDAITFLWRCADKPAAAGNIPFTDVPAGKYYSTAVAWAAENGIAQSTDAFNPKNICTRADIVTFLYRELG